MGDSDFNEKRLSQEEVAASHTGVRFDEGKAPWSLLMWDAVHEVVKVLRFGAQKYQPRNWEKGMEWSRCYDSAQRHLYAWYQKRENNDKESGLSHLAHAAWNILVLLAYTVRGGHHLENDNRPK